MRYKISKDFVTQKIGKKTSVFAGEKSVLFTFNDTAADIFTGLKLGWDKRKIINRLVLKYKVNPEEAGEDLENFIEELLRKKIITVT